MAGKEHQKHAKLPRTSAGEWARNELSILGAPCAVIQQLAVAINARLSAKWNIAFADADHHSDDVADMPATVYYRDKIHSRQLTLSKDLNTFERRTIFNDQDLVLVNGNHFNAQAQIIIIDEAKPLEKKLDRLTNVALILASLPESIIPEYLKQHLPHEAQIPMLSMHDTDSIADFIDQYLTQRIPLLNGLVLAGGQSTRMRKDKGLLQYHQQTNQRTHVYNMLQPLCAEVILSCNAEQAREADGRVRILQDCFLGLGPMGGILSAMQSAPDRAWLCVACDLPYLDIPTLEYLISKRNPAKYATAFKNESQGFPEPMITIWEPRSYPLLLQFLSMGYSCPRKLLINSAIELVALPDQSRLENVNEPEAYQQAFQIINQ